MIKLPANSFLVRSYSLAWRWPSSFYGLYFVLSKKLSTFFLDCFYFAFINSQVHVFPHELKISIVTFWSLSGHFQNSERKSIKTGATHQVVGKALYMLYLIPTKSTKDNVLEFFRKKRTNRMQIDRYYGGLPHRIMEAERSHICSQQTASPGKLVV